MRTTSQNLLIACIFVCLPVYVHSVAYPATGTTGCADCDASGNCVTCTTTTDFIDSD
jgi:hypothetical protein